MLDKSKYLLRIFEGKGQLVSQVKVFRSDWEPIGNTEVKDLISEFERLFPSNIYRIKYQTKPEEDDVILHVYVTLNYDERLRRTNSINQRVIVPEEEIKEQLKDW